MEGKIVVRDESSPTREMNIENDQDLSLPVPQLIGFNQLKIDPDTVRTPFR